MIYVSITARIFWSLYFYIYSQCSHFFMQQKMQMPTTSSLPVEQVASFQPKHLPFFQYPIPYNFRPIVLPRTTYNDQGEKNTSSNYFHIVNIYSQTNNNFILLILIGTGLPIIHMSTVLMLLTSEARVTTFGEDFKWQLLEKQCFLLAMIIIIIFFKGCLLCYEVDLYVLLFKMMQTVVLRFYQSTSANEDKISIIIKWIIWNLCLLRLIQHH